MKCKGRKGKEREGEKGQARRSIAYWIRKKHTIERIHRQDGQTDRLQ